MFPTNDQFGALSSCLHHSFKSLNVTSRKPVDVGSHKTQIHYCPSSAILDQISAFKEKLPHDGSFSVKTLARSESGTLLSNLVWLPRLIGPLHSSSFSLFSSLALSPIVFCCPHHRLWGSCVYFSGFVCLFVCFSKLGFPWVALADLQLSLLLKRCLLLE